MEDREKPGDDWIMEDLAHHYRQRLNLLDESASGVESSLRGEYREYRTIAMHLRAVERAALIQLWTENQINDDVLRELERELDLEDARFASLTH